MGYNLADSAHSSPATSPEPPVMPTLSNTSLPLILTLLLMAGGCSNEALVQPAQLPYDNSNPVIYDNDWTNDYVDWYLMALASAGDIQYVGIIVRRRHQNTYVDPSWEGQFLEVLLGGHWRL